MSKKNKEFIKGVDEGGGSLYSQTLQMYREKYFNLYRTQFKWTGLDYRQEKFIMAQFYGEGKVAAFKIKHIDELGFADFAVSQHDIYGSPEVVSLISKYGDKSHIIPIGNQIVDKDVVIGYIQRNEKPLKITVDWYLKRIAAAEMVINTNLNLHKMPFLIPVDEADSDKFKNVVENILNNELVVYVKGIDPNMLKSVDTNVPYIIDKLCEYKATVENELKTFLGINNQGIEKQEQLQLSEVNANNDIINDSERSFLDCLQEFCKNIKDTFGINISVEATSTPIITEGEVHDIDKDNKPGPKGGEDNE